MYKCKNNNDCENDYLCCASCPDLGKCLKSGIVCEVIQCGGSAINCESVVITEVDLGELIKENRLLRTAKTMYDLELSATQIEKDSLIAENAELKEQYRLLESGNKQVLEEYKITLIEKLRYWKVIEWIKSQYDTDFTSEEIAELEPRDASIYEAIEEVLGLK